MIVRRAGGLKAHDERRRQRGGEEEKKEEEDEEEKPTETAAVAAAVTSRLVFLITSDPGKAEEEEELLSDVSIMTRLCTEARIYIVYPARKTSTGCEGRGGEKREEARRVFVHASGLFPPREQGGNRKAR